MIQHYNPYLNQGSNMLPPQQILQANGKASIDSLRMSPNSSVLIADSTAPIVWRCVSDGLGNVTSQAFDIVPHKTQEEIEKDNLANVIGNLEKRIKALEEQNDKSTSKQYSKSDDDKYLEDKKDAARSKKSGGNSKSNDAE